MNSRLEKNFTNQRRLTPTGGKRDVGCRIERKHDQNDGDRQQQERNDRAVERQIGGIACIEAPAHAICLSPASRPRIVL